MAKQYFLLKDGDIPVSETSFFFKEKIRTTNVVQEAR